MPDGLPYRIHVSSDIGPRKAAVDDRPEWVTAEVQAGEPRIGRRQARVRPNPVRHRNKARLIVVTRC
jgi:hypothetical protein